MRELTLTGDVCFVLRKIQELTELAPSGSNILYPIENWDPHSIKATDEKKNLETLDAINHVIKLKGTPVREGRNLIFSLIKTKFFGEYYNLNCKIDSTDKFRVTNQSEKIKIHINEMKGLYRDDNLQLRYEVRRQRKQFILNLLHGHSINYNFPNVYASNISKAVTKINQLCRVKLRIDFDFIDHSDSSSYFLNETDCLLIEDEISPIGISDG